MSFHSKLISLSSILLAFLATSQTFAQNEEKTTQTIIPADDNLRRMMQELDRVPGQTSFLRPQVMMFRAMAASAKGGTLESAPAGGAKREITEADVFAYLPNQTLALLNPYRGLQLVNFSDRNNPKLVSRMAPTGNYPTKMYSVPARNRLVVLERDWAEASRSRTPYDQINSRLLVIKASSEPASASAEEIIEVEGQIADSVQIGDILYLATTIPAKRNQWTGEEQSKPVSKLLSFNITGEKVTKIDEQALPFPVSRMENMGFIETKTPDGKYEYRLTAVLSESGYGWWDQQSIVEVVDVNDPAGKIKPGLVAYLKGHVDARSWTNFKDGHLLAASNYQIDTGNPNERVQRVSVQSFALPKPGDSILSPADFALVKAQIDVAIQNLGQENVRPDRSTLLEKALQGKFVRDENGFIIKYVADSQKTAGDTRGMSADVQDVRWTNDRAVVAWVPRDKKDPIDIYDTSNVSDLKAVSRTEFDGWFEKIQVLEYKGHKFLLGLGYEVPPFDNEQNRRLPMVKIFELHDSGKPTELDSLLLQDFWANLNGEDRLFEFRVSESGEGTAMFQVAQQVGNRYVQGGKLIGFNLEAALQGTAAQGKILKEGGLIKGDAGYLERVFRNRDLSKLWNLSVVQTFTSQALATYELPANEVGEASHIFADMKVVELARDLIATPNLDLPQQNLAVQIIRDNNYGFYGSGDTSKTELRLVPALKGDAEKPAALGSLKLDGAYVDHIQTMPGALLIVTSEWNWSANDSQQKFFANEVRVQPDHSLKVVSTAEWTRKAGESSPIRIQAGNRITKLNGQEFAFTSGNQLKLLRFPLEAGGPSLQPIRISVENVKIDGLNLPKDSSAVVYEQEGNLWIWYTEAVHAVDDVTYLRDRIAKVKVDASGAWKAEAPRNIGGQPEWISDTQIITRDSQLTDQQIIHHKRSDGTEWNENRTLISDCLSAYQLDGNHAMLTDVDRANVGHSNETKVAGASLAWFENAPAYRGGFFPMVARMGFFPRPWGTPQYSGIASLNLDQNGRFHYSKKFIDGLELNDGYVSLISLQRIPHSVGEYVGVLGSGRTAQVFQWTPGSSARVLPVRTLDTNLQPAAAESTTFETNNYLWANGTRDSVAVDPHSLSIRISQGLSGVCQVLVSGLNRSVQTLDPRFVTPQSAVDPQLPHPKD